MRLFILLTLSIPLLSCTSLRTADYQPQGEQFRRPAGQVRLDWPIVAPSYVNRGFKTGWNKHWGIDFSGRRGAPILAAHDGTVIYAGRHFNGFGKLAIIESPGGFATFYAHLNNFEVPQGATVRAGDLIGRMGSTGRTTGVHLHFELRMDKTPVDPMPYLPSH